MQICPNMESWKHNSYLHIWAQMGHAQIWAYTDDISNLHIWAQKGQGLPDTETQLSIYAHIWSCTFGYKTTLHNNPIYGDSPSAAMPKYGVCCLTSYMATNEACPNTGYCILMTSAISIYGHKRDNEICPNMES